MSGTVLGAFNSLQELTTPTYLQAPEGILNMSGKRNYLWTDAFEGNKTAIQGGTKIRASLIWKDNGTYTHILPGQWRDWINPQLVDKVTAPWRFTEVHKSWTEQEILLNEKVKFGGERQRAEAFAEITMEKDMGAESALANGIENDLFGVPLKGSMETEDSLTPLPYSFFSFVNEDLNGLFGENWTGNTWTTVEGVDPTSASVDGQWTPQQSTYGVTTADSHDNVIGGLDDLFMRCNFQAPRTFEQYYQDPVMSKQKFITTRMGRRAITSLFGGRVDNFLAGKQDAAVPHPQMHGIPIVNVDALETAAVYDDGSNGLTTEALADLKGPRFYAWNMHFLFPVFDEERWRSKGPVMQHMNVPDTHVQKMASWWNLFCWSRKHQGVLSPSVDLYYP
jgi:hypothetical protein